MSKLKFGLNTGALASVPTMETAKTGKSYLKMVVKFGDRTKFWFGFFPDRTWDEDGNVITDMQDDRLKAEIVQFFDTLAHIYKALGVQNTDRLPKEGFSNYVARMNTQARASYVDVFLQYEPTLKAGNDRTWLEIPRNLKFGEFIAPAVPGDWEEQTAGDGGLFYVDATTGTVHTFERDDWFVNTSNFAKPQGEIKRGPSRKAAKRRVTTSEGKMGEVYTSKGELADPPQDKSYTGGEESDDSGYHDDLPF